ncbi:tetratricopeptide repeat protein [Candidatus Auribacterota bacterium]
MKLRNAKMLQLIIVVFLASVTCGAVKYAYAYDKEAVRHYNRGLDLMADNNARRAVTEFKKALEVEPFFAEAVFNLGVIYQNRGDSDSALAEYEKAISIDQNDAEIFRNIGLLYIKRKDYDAAVKYFYEALFLDPEDNDTRYYLADTLRLAGRYDESLKEVSELIDRDPDGPEPYLLLGIIYEKKKMPVEEILVCYKTYISLGGKNKQVKELVRRLEDEVEY